MHCPASRDACVSPRRGNRSCSELSLLCSGGIPSVAQGRPLRIISSIKGPLSSLLTDFFGTVANPLWDKQLRRRRVVCVCEFTVRRWLHKLAFCDKAGTSDLVFCHGSIDGWRGHAAARVTVLGTCQEMHGHATARGCARGLAPRKMAKVEFSGRLARGGADRKPHLRRSPWRPERQEEENGYFARSTPT